MSNQEKAKSDQGMEHIDKVLKDSIELDDAGEDELLNSPEPQKKVKKRQHGRNAMWRQANHALRCIAKLKDELEGVNRQTEGPTGLRKGIATRIQGCIREAQQAAQQTSSTIK